MDNKEYTIDLMEVAGIIKDNCKPIVKVTGSVIGVAVIYLLLAWNFFPTYESEAMLQIINNQRGSGMLALLTGSGPADFLNMSSSQVDSYIEILKSRGVVIPVIQATEKANSDGKFPDYKKYVRTRIHIENSQFSDIVTVRVTGKTAEKAQLANELLLDSFFSRVADLNSAQKGSIKKFLSERLKTAKEELNKAETALEKFKVENRILSPSDNAHIFAERILEIEKQAAANKVELEAAEAQLATINQQLSGSGVASADNITLQQYNTALANLEATRIAYKEKYTEKHPRMIEINEQIDRLKAKIQEEASKIAALQAPSDNDVHQGLVSGKFTSEGAVSVARQKQEALQKLIDQNNAELAKLPAKEQEYIRLSRDYVVANEIYMMLTKQLEQTKITEFQQPTNVLMVDKPTLPEKPISPRRGVTLILAALLGLLFSSGYLVFKELQNRTIRNTKTITDYVGLPVFGSIPDKEFLVQVQEAAQVPGKRGFLDKVREYVWKK